jgi:hypothetical protein
MYTEDDTFSHKEFDDDEDVDDEIDPALQAKIDRLGSILCTLFALIAYKIFFFSVCKWLSAYYCLKNSCSRRSLASLVISGQ